MPGINRLGVLQSPLTMASSAPHRSSRDCGVGESVFARYTQGGTSAAAFLLGIESQLQQGEHGRAQVPVGSTEERGPTQEVPS